MESYSFKMRTTTVCFKINCGKKKWRAEPWNPSSISPLFPVPSRSGPDVGASGSLPVGRTEKKRVSSVIQCGSLRTATHMHVSHGMHRVLLLCGKSPFILLLFHNLPLLVHEDPYVWHASCVRHMMLIGLGSKKASEKWLRK